MVKKKIINKIGIPSVCILLILAITQCGDPNTNNQGTQNTNNNNTIKDTQADLKKKEEKIIAYKKFIEKRPYLAANQDIQQITNKSKDIKNITKDDINKIDTIIEERKKLEEKFKKINKDKNQDVRKLEDAKIKQKINDEKDKAKKENLNKLNVQQLKKNILDKQYTKNGYDKYSTDDLKKITTKDDLAKIILDGEKFKKNVKDINIILKENTEELKENDLKKLFSTKKQEEVETIKQYLKKRNEANNKNKSQDILKILPIIPKFKINLEKFDQNLTNKLKYIKEEKLNKEIENLIKSEFLNKSEDELIIINGITNLPINLNEDKTQVYKTRLTEYSKDLNQQKILLQQIKMIHNKVQKLYTKFIENGTKEIKTLYNDVKTKEDIYTKIINNTTDREEENVSSRINNINKDISNIEIGQEILNRIMNNKQILITKDKTYPKITEILGSNYKDREYKLKKLKNIKRRNDIIYYTYGKDTIQKLNGKYITKNNNIKDYIINEIININEDINTQISNIMIFLYINDPLNNKKGTPELNETVFKTLTKYKSSFPLTTFIEKSKNMNDLKNIKNLLNSVIKDNKSGSLLYSHITKNNNLGEVEYNQTTFNNEEIQTFLKEEFYNFVTNNKITDNKFLVKIFETIHEELKKTLYTELFNDNIKFTNFVKSATTLIKDSNIIQSLGTIKVPAIDNLRNLHDYKLESINNNFKSLLKQLILIPDGLGKNIQHYMAQGIIECIHQQQIKKDKNKEDIIFKNFLNLINFFKTKFQMTNKKLKNTLIQEFQTIIDDSYEDLKDTTFNFIHISDNSHASIIDLTYTTKK